MTGRTLSRAAVSAALVVSCLSAPAAAQLAPVGPGSGTLPSGLTYQLRPDPAQPGAAVALWYRAPAAGFGPRPQPGIARLAAATVAGSTPVTGTPLSRVIEHFGGRITVAAYADSVTITALVPPERVADTVRAMTAGYFAPVLSAQGLGQAQQELADDAVYRSFDVQQSLEDLLGESLFAAGPLHDGVVGTPSGYRGLTLSQVRAYAERAFRPANAILVLTGDVGAAALGAVATRVGASPGVEPPAAEMPRPAPAPLRRTGNVAGIGLGWIGPPIADEAAATALDFVADALFAPGSGSVAKAIGARKATVSGKFVTYHDPGLFVVTISGDDAAAVRPLVEAAVAAATTPLAGPAFAQARAGFTYRILASNETPTDLASVYGWYTVEGNPGYAPAEAAGGRYFGLAAGLTPAAVAQTVARYLGPPPAVVSLALPSPSPAPAAAANKAAR